jgi:hypothetical protein
MLVCVVIMDLHWHLLAWVGSCGDLTGFWWVERGVCNHERVLLGVNGCLWVKTRVGGANGSKTGAGGLRHAAGGVNGSWWVQTGVLVSWQWVLAPGNVRINISRVK